MVYNPQILPKIGLKLIHSAYPVLFHAFFMCRSIQLQTVLHNLNRSNAKTAGGDPSGRLMHI